MDRGEILNRLAAKNGGDPSDYEIISVREWDESNEHQKIHYTEVRYRIKGRDVYDFFSNARDRAEQAKAQYPVEFSLAWLEGREVNWDAIGLSDVIAAGPLSILATTGGLKAHEGVILKSNEPSHGLDKHCELTMEALEGRVRRNGKPATSFSFREIMEIVVGSTLETDRQNILNWVRHGADKRKYLVRKDVGQSVGYGCFKHPVTRALVRVPEISTVTIILEKTPAKNGLPFTIVTAYPDVRQLRQDLKDKR
jgi:hypothetical protein